MQSRFGLPLVMRLSAEEEEEKRKKILDEADVEEEKRDLITREIGKFREIMKVSSFVVET